MQQYNPDNIQHEKSKLLVMIDKFLDGISFEEKIKEGRPSAPLQDVIKCLLVMSYHSWSYRRCYSDLQTLYDSNSINFIPKRSTISKYMNDSNLEDKLTELISLSGLPLAHISETLIIDSTWYQKMMNVASAHKNKTRTLKLHSFYKTRKFHVGMFKETKIVTYARGTPGTIHDSLIFEEIVRNTCANFKVRVLLADKGYCNKKAYSLCEELNIRYAFIDFKSNVNMKRGKSKLWKDSLDLHRNNPELWNEFYRFRPLIESLFSAWKRKNLNYIRCRNTTSQNCELLLKALVHNLIILSDHYLTFMDIK